MYFYRETDESLTKKQSVPGVSVKKPTNRIADKYAISKEEFNSETVSIMFWMMSTYLLWWISNIPISKEISR